MCVTLFSFPLIFLLHFLFSVAPLPDFRPEKSLTTEGDDEDEKELAAIIVYPDCILSSYEVLVATDKNKPRASCRWRIARPDR